MKQNIKDFIKEIVPIIAGILIALYINDWNDHRKDQAYIDQIFSSINKELTQSNEDIIYQIALQKKLVDTLDHYLKDSTTSLTDILTKGKGINKPVVNMSSWKAISNSRIELVDYQRLSTLSNIEEQKINLNTQVEKLVDYYYLNAEETGKEKKELMKLMMLSIIGQEKAIQKNIEVIIDD